MFKSGRDWQIKPILVDLVSNISIISAIYLTYTNLPLALIFVYNIYCQKTALYFSGQGKVNLDNCFYFLWFIPCNKYWRMSLTNLIRASDCNCLQLLTTKFVLSKLIINNIPKILLNRYNFFNEIPFFVILKILTNLI